jgi:hypothetical protein
MDISRLRSALLIVACSAAACAGRGEGDGPVGLETPAGDFVPLMPSSSGGSTGPGASSGDDADVLGSDAEVTEPPANDETGANTDDADEPDDGSPTTTGPAADAGAPGSASGCVASSCNNAATCLLVGTAPCCTTSGACGCDYSYGFGLLCQ